MVRGQSLSGKTMKTDMVFEDNGWRLQVPGQLVKMLDNPQDLLALAHDKPVPYRPKLPTGGGGTAGRSKALPKDAPPKDVTKAKALDAFDLGVMTNIEKLFHEALKLNPDDEELTVALGRAYVQKGEGKKGGRFARSARQKRPKGTSHAPLLGYGLHDGKSTDGGGPRLA